MVIDGKYRGQGLGGKLTRLLISEAKKRKARWIEFTSRKDRTATNRFYQKFGFKPRDTNVYRLSL
jgi:ribosomal protein S18 acetylase RimI-like enzyme